MTEAVVSGQCSMASENKNQRLRIAQIYEDLPSCFLVVSSTLLYLNGFFWPLATNH